MFIAGTSTPWWSIYLTTSLWEQMSRLRGDFIFRLRAAGYQADSWCEILFLMLSFSFRQNCECCKVTVTRCIPQTSKSLPFIQVLSRQINWFKTVWSYQNLISPKLKVISQRVIFQRSSRWVETIMLISLVVNHFDRFRYTYPLRFNRIALPTLIN